MKGFDMVRIKSWLLVLAVYWMFGRVNGDMVLNMITSFMNMVGEEMKKKTKVLYCRRTVLNENKLVFQKGFNYPIIREEILLGLLHYHIKNVQGDEHIVPWDQWGNYHFERRV